jgi:hypothetical protein
MAIGLASPGHVERMRGEGPCHAASSTESQAIDINVTVDKE